MRKLVFFIVSIFVLSTSILTAQNVLNGGYVKERDINRKFIPYPHLREADVMWSKEIVRVIDLREKMNLPLYYPVNPLGERKSLIDVILDGIKNEGLRVYEAKPEIGNEFLKEILWPEIELMFGAGVDTQYVTDVETGERVPKVVNNELHSSDVKEYLVKEVWYFDRKYSSLQVRIIGLCPLRYFQKTDQVAAGAEENLGEEDIDNTQKMMLFWVYFPDLRPLLANHEVFNTFNDAERRTFDDIFFKRKFSSVVYQESNVYNNRNINEYSLGLNSMLEAERIKQWIFDTEHDLWEY